MKDRELLKQVKLALEDVIAFNDVTYDGPTAERWKQAANRMNQAGGQFDYLRSLCDKIDEALEVGTGTQWYMDLPSEEAQGEAIGICANLDMHTSDFKTEDAFLRAVRYHIIDLLEEVNGVK